MGGDEDDVVVVVGQRELDENDAENSGHTLDEEDEMTDGLALNEADDVFWII